MVMVRNVIRQTEGICNMHALMTVQWNEDGIESLMLAVNKLEANKIIKFNIKVVIYQPMHNRFALKEY